MKTYYKLFLLSFSLLMVASACGGENGPVIILDSPINNADYLIGDTLVLSGNVTDDMTIDSVIFFAADFFRASLNVNSVTDRSDIDFESDIIIDSTVVKGDYTLEVTAYDNEDNNTMESINFSVN